MVSSCLSLNRESRHKLVVVNLHFLPSKMSNFIDSKTRERSNKTNYMGVRRNESDSDVDSESSLTRVSGGLSPLTLKASRHSQLIDTKLEQVLGTYDDWDDRLPVHTKSPIKPRANLKMSKSHTTDDLPIPSKSKLLEDANGDLESRILRLSEPRAKSPPLNVNTRKDNAIKVKSEKPLADLGLNTRYGDTNHVIVGPTKANGIGKVDPTLTPKKLPFSKASDEGVNIPVQNKTMDPQNLKTKLIQKSTHEIPRSPTKEVGQGTATPIKKPAIVETKHVGTTGTTSVKITDIPKPKNKTQETTTTTTTKKEEKLVVPPSRNVPRVSVSPAKSTDGKSIPGDKKSGTSPSKLNTKKEEAKIQDTKAKLDEASKEKEERKKEEARDRTIAMQILHLAHISEWKGVEQGVRTMERTVQLGLTKNTKPLVGISDKETGWTPLMFAVKDNRIQLADQMITLGSDINARNHDGLTPLHIATLLAREDTVRYLVLRRADPNALTQTQKQSAVHLACSRGFVPDGFDTSVLKTLLSVAAKNTRLLKDAGGHIPLVIAVVAGSYEACQELLNKFAIDQLEVKSGPQKDTPLHLAVKRKDVELATLLIDRGANVDAKNGDGQTALHLAVVDGNENMLLLLHLCKANPNIMDNQERTPIHIAAQLGHTKVVEMLADKFKASVLERTKDGSTLMHIASLHGHPDAAMALHRRGVPLHMPNKIGARSLHIAAKHGHTALITKLMEKGEQVDARTNDNFTALHVAVNAGHPHVVEKLLGFGAQVHIKGGENLETPLHIASRIDDGDKCASMLLNSGADTNIKMENGETPLHVAARHGRLRIIKLLLANGGEPTSRSTTGETPLHLGCHFGHLGVVKELVESIRKGKGEEEAGVYINTLTNKGESALHYASTAGNDNEGKSGISGEDNARQIAQLLLKCGASVFQQTKDTSETPFHYCARDGNNEILKEMVKTLSDVECGRALNKQSSTGWTLLHLASHKGHSVVVKTLLENKARVDVFDKEGRSALHLAAERGYQEICGMILNHKAFINSKSRTGFTALHFAAFEGYHKLCLSLVQDFGATVDVLTLRKQTPLHLAAGNGKIEVCRVLMGVRANIDAMDDKGQRPIHMAAQNNHEDIIKLFLKISPSLATTATKDGSTCAHLAAKQGSVSVLKQLIQFDKSVISAKNRTTDSTALHFAAEGGHADLVKTLVDAGASASDENRAGYSAVHLAAKNGHTNVIEVLRNSETKDSLVINKMSLKLGLTALHIASYFGQTETVRELLSSIPVTSTSTPPISLAASFLKDLGLESGLTPLHLAAFSGEENVVRLLLNSEGIQVGAKTTDFGFSPVHLACRGGHTTVVALILSRSSELLERKDNEGKTGLHIAAIQGHHHMVDFLVGQGAEIDSLDKMEWTPLHCTSKAGHLDVVKLLVESGGSTLAKTLNGQSPLWFAAAERHQPILGYLIKKEHDSYGLIQDRTFVYNLTTCGKNNDNEPLHNFILASPAPVDIAAKLSSMLLLLSTKEKERAKDLSAASKFTENMGAELLGIAAGTESAGKLLRSVDRSNTQFLDVLIEHEQKQVIAASSVQRYLQELWVGSLGWPSWKLLLLFISFLLFPPIWILFSLPCGHKYYKVPIVKFMSYLVSHIYLMILISLTAITPIFPILRSNFFPHWIEWVLLVWILGVIIGELLNPSDKSGLGWIKVAVIFFCSMALIIHGLGFVFGKPWAQHIFYWRNQLFAAGMLAGCVQILDFVSFHYLFGPWAIIIGNLMKDLARFLAVLAIFMFGFSMVITSLNQPFTKRTAMDINNTKPRITNGLSTGVIITPVDALEALFFAIFGLRNTDDLKWETAQPNWTVYLFKFVHAIYLLVTVIVLINLLIAMMSDTYQRIQAQSDIEWKFGLAKLIRNMHRTSATPSPINLLTTWVVWIGRQCRKKRDPFSKSRKTKEKGMIGATAKGLGGMMQFGKATPKQLWKSSINRTKGRPQVSDIMRLTAPQVGVGTTTPGNSAVQRSTLSQRIETVVDWDLVVKKYRTLVGREEVEETQQDNEKINLLPPDK